MGQPPFSTKGSVVTGNLECQCGAGCEYITAYLQLGYESIDPLGTVWVFRYGSSGMGIRYYRYRNQDQRGVIFPLDQDTTPTLDDLKG